jgi:hypothetical protein
LGCLLIIALTCLFAKASTDYVIPCVLAWAAVSFSKLCRKDGLGEKPFLAKLLTISSSRTHTYTHTLTHLHKLGIYAELGAPNDLIRATFDPETINFVRIGDGIIGWIIVMCVAAKVILPTSVVTCRRRYPASEGETTLLRTNNSE